MYDIRKHMMQLIRDRLAQKGFDYRYIRDRTGMSRQRAHTLVNKPMTLKAFERCLKALNLEIKGCTFKLGRIHETDYEI